MCNMRIGLRLFIGFLILLLVLVAVGLTGVNGIQKAERDLSNFAKVYLPSIESLAGIRYNLTRIYSLQKIALVKNYGNKEAIQKTVVDARDQYRKELAKYESLPRTAEEDKKWSEFKAILEKATAQNVQILTWIKEAESGVNSEKAYADAVRLASGDYDATYTALMDTLGQVMASNMEKAKVSQERAEAEAAQKGLFLTAAMVVGALLALALGWLLTRSITRPLSQTVRFASGVAGGRLDERLDIDQKDEVGVLAQSLRTMVGDLRNKMDFTQGILQGITAPYVIIGFDDKLQYLNQSTLDFYERQGPPEKYVGELAAMFFYGDASRETLTSKVLRTGNQILHHNMELTTPSGKKKAALLDISPMKSQDGKVIAAIVVFMDVTQIVEQQKKAESARAEGMLAAAHQLEEVVQVATSASGQLSRQVEQSSRGAAEQSQRVGETATAMEEMNSTVLEVARNASQAAQTSESASHKAQEGARIVGQVVTGIEDVRRQALSIKEDMAKLGQQADGIGSIMNVISDIADQTNLLALNAAIEAARAGEAGRGFAVVADEVRKLAEKTMTATKEVGDAIRGIQESTQRNIANVDASGKVIEEATSLANTSGATLHEIVALVDQASDQVRAIAAASQEQSAASEQINRSIEQVAQISSETSQAMTDAAQAVTDLTNQTNILTQLINGMKQEGGAASGQKALAAR